MSILHNFKLGYVSFGVIERFKNAGQPFSIADVKRVAKERGYLEEKTVRAFTARDALDQLRATEGGSFNKPPFVLTIEPLEEIPLVPIYPPIRTSLPGYNITIGDNATMHFGDALEALNEGKRVARMGWNGKGMWIALQIPDENSFMTLRYIYMKTADENRVPWLASQTDLLANDWFLVVD